MSEAYPNSGPNADLGRYRTGETPMVGDVVRFAKDGNGPYIVGGIDDDHRVWFRKHSWPHVPICELDLISRADSPDAGKMVDWTEDFQHENGRYFVVCGQCGVQFLGHKRRHYCKRCSSERQTVSSPAAEPAPEPTLLEAAERVVWGIYRNGKLADVALTRSAMEYETEYAIGYRSNTAQAMLLCKASPEQIAAVERAKGGG